MIHSGAGIFLIETTYLLPLAQVSTFFSDKKLFAYESSIGLYPSCIYSLSQLLLELWVMVLCVLAMTVIAVPMMGLWNVSLTWLSSMAYVFSVLCVSGLVSNSLVMISWLSACSMVLVLLFLFSPCLITWGCDHSPAAYFLHCILAGSCLSSWIWKNNSFSCFIRRLCPLSVHQGLDCLVAVDFSSEILLPGICLESFGPNTSEAHSWNACFRCTIIRGL